MRRILFGVALAGALSGVSLVAAPRTQASIILNVPAQSGFVAASASAEYEPRLGETVSFTVTAPDSLNRDFLFVNVLCYQGPDHVLVFAVAKRPTDPVLLGGISSPWLANGGDVSCQAELFYWSKGGKYTVIAATDFEAVG